MANRNNRMQMGRRSDQMGRSDFNRGGNMNRMSGGGGDFNRGGGGIGGMSQQNVSPWQTSGGGGGLQMPLASTEAALSLISNLLQQTRPSVPSLLDLPVQQGFNRSYDNRPPNNFDRFSGNRMGNQNFRRSGVIGQTQDHPSQRRQQQSGNRRDFQQKNKESGFKKKQPAKKNEAVEKKKDIKQEPSESTEGAEGQESMEVEEAQNKSGTSTGDKTRTKSGGDDKKNRYDEISPSLLVCHICNKSMWDGRSFENHINGRAHSLMLDKVGESYALNADMMRQEQKFRESKKRRRPPSAQDFYCAMCDITAEDGPSHRTTPAHRKLKRYLHPQCNVCHKEMATRIELDQHKLSYEHLIKMQNEKPVKAEVTISTVQTEKHYYEMDKKKAVDKNVKSTTGDAENADEATTSEIKVEEQPNLILDFKEDELTVVNKADIPPYSHERQVGTSFIHTFQCLRCDLCDKLLENDEAAEYHLKTRKHYNTFAHRLHKLVPVQEKDPKKRSADEAELDASVDESKKACQENGTDEVMEESCGEIQDADCILDEGGELEGEEIEEEAFDEQEEQGGEEDMAEEKTSWDSAWEKDLDEVLQCAKSDSEEVQQSQEDIEREAQEAAEAEKQRLLEEKKKQEEAAAVKKVATPVRQTATRGGRGRGRGRGK